MSLMMVRLKARMAVAFAAQEIKPWGGFSTTGLAPPFDYDAFLRAMLLELREPTEEMHDAAIATVVHENGGLEYGPVICWKAMIDEVMA